MNNIDIQGHLQKLLVFSRLEEFGEIDRFYQKFSVATRILTARMVMAGGRCSPAGLRLLVHVAQDESPEVRAAAFITLARYTGNIPEWLIERVTRMREPDPWVELFRIRFIQKCCNDTVDNTMVALTYSATFPQMWVQDEILKTLEMITRSKGRYALRRIVTWLEEPNSHVKETALRFFSSNIDLIDKEVFEIIYGCCRDPSHLVRRKCAVILSKYVIRWPERTIPQLITMATDSSHWSLRLAVIRGLTSWYEHSHWSALTIIKHCIGDPVRVVRTQALRQLRKLTRVYPALTLQTVYRWYDVKETDIDALIVCLEEVSNSERLSVNQARDLLKKHNGIISINTGT